MKLLVSLVALLATANLAMAENMDDTKQWQKENAATTVCEGASLPVFTCVLKAKASGSNGTFIFFPIGEGIKGEGTLYCADFVNAATGLGFWQQDVAVEIENSVGFGLNYQENIEAYVQLSLEVGVQDPNAVYGSFYQVGLNGTFLKAALGLGVQAGGKATSCNVKAGGYVAVTAGDGLGASLDVKKLTISPLD